MADSMVADWERLGERVALARAAMSMPQAELASRVGLERSALSKIESGARRVSALELSRIGDALGRSLEWFLVSSPAAIASRRAERADGALGPELDAELTLESLALELGQLTALQTLERPIAGRRVLERFGAVNNDEDARAAARLVRAECAAPLEPIASMATAFDRFGLFVYSLDLVSGIDGLMVRVDDEIGVCLINGSGEPGRRRATAAHELGHFLFDDAYSAEVLRFSSGDQRERLIDAFAAEFLLPLETLRAIWARRGGRSQPRAAAVTIAAEFRVSWGGLLVRLSNCGMLEPGQRRALEIAPTRAEFIAIAGRAPEPDLESPGLSPGVVRAVLDAYSKDLIAEARALELLHGLEKQLPPRPLLALHRFKGDFFPDS